MFSVVAFLCDRLLKATSTLTGKTVREPERDRVCGGRLEKIRSEGGKLIGFRCLACSDVRGLAGNVNPRAPKCAECGCANGHATGCKENSGKETAADGKGKTRKAQRTAGNGPSH